MATYDSIDQGVMTRLSTRPNQIIVSIEKANASPGGSYAASQRMPAKRDGVGEYLRGPIPWLWLRSAYSIRPSCMLVAMGLWHWRALNKNPTFPVSMHRLAEFLGISYRTVLRMVETMSRAGMIRVVRRKGARHIFTIVEDLGQ